jgi:hypothetical protein
MDRISSIDKKNSTIFGMNEAHNRFDGLIEKLPLPWNSSDFGNSLIPAEHQG